MQGNRISGQPQRQHRPSQENVQNRQPGKRRRIIVAHNHPGGDPAPSQNDIDITRKLVETGRVVGIELYDHIIIGTAGS